ncbi:MAG: hypothetical protein EOM24_16785, partial [Chloroflexia bacterium]|nr:hypothetical protein [Chloroflexia bacterium]
MMQTGWQPDIWFIALVAPVLLFVIPGWGLLRCWRESTRLTWLEQAALASGIGLALYPLLLLWTRSLGLSAGAFYAWGPVALGLLVMGWHFFRRSGHVPWQAWRQSTQRDDLWPLVALAGVGLTLFIVRLLIIADLQFPLWGDSVHHTMITQLLIYNGGLFDSWQPYAAMETFTYHFGFHSHVAALIWLTGIDAPQAVLVGGQLANAAAVLTLYPLALRLGHNQWAGVASWLIAGLLLAMPMLYVNWGRYPQLDGQAILPVAIALLWYYLAAPRPARALFVLTACTMAGLVLTHYRVAIFAACFVPAYLVVMGGQGAWRALMTKLVLLVLAVALLILPWVLRVFEGSLVDLMGGIFAASRPGSGLATQAEAINAIGDPLFFLPALVWYAMLVSLVWAVWRREQALLVVVVWWLGALLVVNPQSLGLPGAGTITNFALFIAAYIPAALLLAAPIGWLLHHVRAPAALAGITVVTLALGFWGGTMRLHDLDVATHALVQPEDLVAMAWIELHIPEDAHFLVNGFFSHPASVVGGDAGWWLPLLAQRPSTLPPILYIAEQGPRPDYVVWVNELYATIERLGIEHPTTLAMLREREIAYIYLGQQQGMIGNPDPTRVLDPAVL